MRTIAVLIAGLALTGCAHNYVDMYEPVIDTQGVDINAYNSDLRDCRAFAVREDPTRKAAQAAIAGALIGVALGAAVGGAYGQAGRGAALGGSEGAVFGGVSGAASGLEAQRIIVNRCMAGRDYRVLY